MLLTVQRDVYDSRVDSLDENICDIYIDNGDNANPLVTGSCVIVGRDTVRLGTSRKYTAIFTDARGDVAIVNPIWSIAAPEGVSYNTSDAECAISVPLDEKYVGEIITIAVSDADHVFGSYEKKVQVITVG